MPRRVLRVVAAWSVVALAICGVAACAGDRISGAEPAETFELRKDRALFWEVSPPRERDVRLYLLGSIHVLDVPISLGAGIERAYRDADVLVVEIDLRDATPQELAELAVRYGALGPDEALADLVGPETLDRLYAYCDEHALPPQMVQGLFRMRPWAIAMTLELEQYESAGLRPEHGVDAYFLALAGDDKRVVGLETMDAQMRALSGHSDRTQEELLRIVLDPDAPGAASPHALVDAWKAGDADAVERLVFPPEAAGDAAYADLYEALFFARNARMAARLRELLEEGEPDLVYFAVVGAAHLVGDGSIPEILRDAGYRVER